MVATLALRSTSADDTRAIGRALGGVVRPNDVIALTGDLGAGKTTLVQGLAPALGVEEPVTSPTFVLVREYAGRLPVYHVDVYRLERIQDVLDLGFDEMLESGGVTLIEWGDAVSAVLPGEHVRVELRAADGEREIRISADGASWELRWGMLADAVEAWRS